MRVETIEILLVCVIVSIQFIIFIRTYIQTDIFKNIIPDVSKVKISKLVIPVSSLEFQSPKEILSNVYKYRIAIEKIQNLPDEINEDIINQSLNEFERDYYYNNDKAEVNLLESNEINNTTFDNIKFSINNYLIRNRGATSDFNLIKDIVERNTSAIEEDINLTISLPIYLGLMGTMLGIVIGLFNVPDLSVVLDTNAKDVSLNNGISTLIGGVKIAMIASFSGLLLTIINSGWAFKGARIFSENRKNEFYTFIQIELLPIMNQSMASTLESLQRNLIKFNSEFTINLKQLTGIFDTNINAIKAQKELLDAIDKTKISEMSKYNIKVLRELDVSVGQFEKFNNNFSNVNTFVENTSLIINRTNELLSRTENLKTIANSLNDRLNQSQRLLEFLSEHFNNLEEHKEFTSNAVADVGHSISETFRELKEHIQNSTEVIKQFSVDEIEALKMALSESKTNLSNLEHLASLKNDVSKFKDTSTSQAESLMQQLELLNKNMSKSIAILKGIEDSSLIHQAQGITKSIKQFFKQK